MTARSGLARWLVVTLILMLSGLSGAQAQQYPPLTISGSPPTTVAAGNAYAFTPTVRGDVPGWWVTYSIRNGPTWASFDAPTGLLWGTPQAGDVGTVRNVTISVSDGYRTATLAPFDITVTAPGGSGTPLTISGSPPTTIAAGSAYAFTPTVRGDVPGWWVTYSIRNGPRWASFDPPTGLLWGTPQAGDVGTVQNVTISVSDGYRTATLAPFNITVQSAGVPGSANGSATLSWQPPTKNSDGSALTNLSGYKVYWGNAVGNYPNSVTLTNPGLSSYVVGGLSPGTYYFVITSLNTAGAESAQSNPASKTIQ